jgi:hypothetical protein
LHFFIPPIIRIYLFWLSPPGAAEAILAKSEATARGMRLISDAMTTEGSAKVLRVLDHQNGTKY